MTLQFYENVPLAPLTTLGIGGHARFFVNAVSEAAVIDALTGAQKRGLAVFVLGGGSNILISDEGFDGLVIQMGIKGIEGLGESLTVASGENWDDFVGYCVADRLAGVECLRGIPGSVGGTPVQNVGAYGQEVSETITSVQCIDSETCNTIILDNADCGFSYRTSIFNTTHRDRYIVTAVTYRLAAEGKPKIAYRELSERFADAVPALTEVRNAVLEIRRQKSMVIDAADPNSRSAGSFFKNPIIDHEKLDSLRSEFEDMPFFQFGDKFKVPAAWLIDRSGFHKGFRYSNVGLSANHVLAIVNRGGGTARQVLDLKNMVQDGVLENFGIMLSPEPLFIGFKEFKTI